MPRREALRALELYAPDRAPAAVDLSDNTNLWGPAPSAVEALVAMSGRSESVSRYPSVYADALRDRLARYTGVEADQVVTGCGSDDVLDAALRAFAEPGDLVVAPEPTFHMVPLFAQVNGLRVVKVPLRDAAGRAFDVDDEAMLSADAERGGAKVIYLCSPNNPTGAALSMERIERIAREARGIVLLDEAYAEFADRNALELLATCPRLVIVRTMSKAFGLAGLRIGYAVGAREVVAEIAKARGPYKISAAADVAARGALECDLEWMHRVVAEVRRNRAWLHDALGAMRRGFEVTRSEANFVYVRLGDGLDAAAVVRRMRESGVAVRGFPGAIRVTVGPWAMMESFLAAFSGAIAECS